MAVTSPPLGPGEQLLWRGMRHVGTRVGPRLFALIGAVLLLIVVMGIGMAKMMEQGGPSGGALPLPIPFVMLFFAAIGLANWAWYRQTGRWHRRVFKFWEGSPNRGEYVLTDRRAMRRDQYGHWQWQWLAQTTPVLGDGRFGDKTITFLSETGIEVVSFADIGEADAHWILGTVSRVQPLHEPQRWVAPPPPTWPPHG